MEKRREKAKSFSEVIYRQWYKEGNCEIWTIFVQFSHKKLKSWCVHNKPWWLDGHCIYVIMSALKVKEENSNWDFQSVSFDVNCNDQLICQRNNIFLNA